MVAKHPDSTFMTRAIEIAEAGGAAGDYRIGALIVERDDIVAEAHTNLFEGHDPTAHAEIVAIRRAAASHNHRYLLGCYLYTTLEPCPMCTSAAIWARMGGIVFGASLEDASERGGEWRNGRFYSWRQIMIRARYVADHGTPHLAVHEEFMRSACLDLLPSPRQTNVPYP